MAVFIETPPNVLDGDPQTSVRRLHSYLYQISERLNEALAQVDGKIVEISVQAQKQLASVSQALTGETASMGRTAQEALLHEAEALRSLIIANADEIRNVRDEIVNTLSSDYIARSEFGTYQEQVTQTITETAASQIREYNTSETITTLKENSNETVEFRRQFDDYIKTGLLFRRQDGVLVYGVAVGKKLVRVTQTIDGKEVEVLTGGGVSAAFTADRLSFYEKGEEVAYVSNRQLYISRAIILESFRIGALTLTVDTNGIAATWTTDNA